MFDQHIVVIGLGGQQVRVRIRARNVMIAVRKPDGLNATAALSAEVRI